MKDFKIAAVAACKKEIQNRVNVHTEKMEEIKESIENNETKHGYDNDDSQGELLGDYERYAQLREEHEDMLLKVGNIDFHGGKSTVQEGAIVRTDDKFVLISIPIGELPLREELNKVYAISTEAPIFKAMQGLKKDDQFEHNGRTQTVKEVY
jgi:hypothetical protein